MTWDDNEPDIPDCKYTVKVAMVIEVELTASKGQSEIQLAELAERQIESDPCVNEATASDIEVLEEEVQ